MMIRIRKKRRKCKKRSRIVVTITTTRNRKISPCLFLLFHLHQTLLFNMPFSYKKILVIGATSGIGEDLATRILKESPESKVIAVGRRQEKLDEFVKKHGEDRSVGVSFDITDLDGIPAFAEKYVDGFKYGKTQAS